MDRNGSSVSLSAERKRFSCSVEGCSFGTNKKYKLEEHNRTHDGSRPFACENCSKAFRRIDHLRRHQSTHHPSRIAGGSDSPPRSGDDVSPHFPCPVAGCSSVFKIRHHLKRHVAAIHEQAKVHPCSVEGCPASFSLKRQLRKHLRQEHHMEMHSPPETETPSEPGTEICDYEGCWMLFDTLKELENHVRTVHSSAPSKAEAQPGDQDRVESIHYCSVEGCNRGFSSAGNLRSHMKQCHLEERPFLCPVESCGRSFAFPYMLRRHLAAQHKDHPLPATQQESEEHSEEGTAAPAGKRAKTNLAAVKAPQGKVAPPMHVDLRDVDVVVPQPILGGSEAENFS